MTLPINTVFLYGDEGMMYELDEDTDVFYLDEPRIGIEHDMEVGQFIRNYVADHFIEFARPVLVNEHNPYILGIVYGSITQREIASLSDIVAKFGKRTRYIEYRSNYYRITQDSLVKVEKPRVFINLYSSPEFAPLITLDCE